MGCESEGTALWNIVSYEIAGFSSLGEGVKRGGGAYSISLETAQVGEPRTVVEEQRVAGGEVVGEGQAEGEEGGHDSDGIRERKGDAAALVGFCMRIFCGACGWVDGGCDGLRGSFAQGGIGCHYGTTGKVTGWVDMWRDGSMVSAQRQDWFIVSSSYCP